MNITAKEFTETLNKNDKIRSDVIHKLTNFDYSDFDVNYDELNVTMDLKDEYLKDIPNAQGSISLTIDFNIWDYVDFHQIIMDELASGEYVRDVEPHGDFNVQQLELDLAYFIAKN